MDPAQGLPTQSSFIVIVPQIEGDTRKRGTETRPDSEEPPPKKTKQFDINGIHQQMITCFGNASINGMESVSLKLLAERSFKCANERLLSFKCVAKDEIINIHKLFFETDLQKKSGKIMQQAVNLIDPHPTYVFNSLFNCISALVPHGDTCTKAHEAITTYLKTKPKPGESLEAILALEEEQRNRILLLLEQDQANKPFLSEYKKYLSDTEKFENNMKKFPIISTHDLFPNRIVKNKNETYLFRNKDGLGQWIFKPIMKDGWGANFPLLASREHTASCVNFHHQFPIPKTIFVEINGWQGSAQIYLSDTKNLDEIKNDQLPLKKIFLQKLVIYDLLFSNGDRHEDNLLFKKIMEQLEYQAYGIDHDRCMQGFGESLTLGYLALIEPNDIFEQDLIKLISKENLAKYGEIMKAHQMPGDSITWLHEVASILEEEINNQKTIKNIVIQVKEKWNEYN